MIPYSILVAAIATLIYLIGKLSKTLDEKPSIGWIDYLTSVGLFGCVFFWIQALIGTTLTTYIISAVAAILAVTLYYARLKVAENPKNAVINEQIDTPVGKIGTIIKKIDAEMYMGTLVDGDAIVVHSAEALNDGDNFIVARFDEGEFIATKYNEIK